MIEALKENVYEYTLESELYKVLFPESTKDAAKLKKYSAYIIFIGTKDNCDKRELEYVNYCQDTTNKGKITKELSKKQVSEINTANQEECRVKLLESQVVNLESKLKETEKQLQEVQSILSESQDQVKSLHREIDQLKSDSLDIDKEKLITTGLYLVNKYCNKNHLKEIQVLEEEEDGSKMVLIFSLNFKTKIIKMYILGYFISELYIS